MLDYDLEGEDFATMREIARRDSPVWTIHEATGGEPQRSLRMRNVAMPMGLASELRAVFRTGQACWGTPAWSAARMPSAFPPLKSSS